MISTSCEALEYFTNNIFRFDAYNYNEALARLNEIDKKIYYDRSKVNVVYLLIDFFLHFKQFYKQILTFHFVYFLTVES